MSATKNGAPVLRAYAGKLGATRSGGNNFSFESFDDLDVTVLSALFTEVGRIVAADADNPVRYRQG